MPDPLPHPPPELAGYVIGNIPTHDWRETYDAQGRHVQDAIRAILGPGWTWAGKRVLDFGCGSARVLRHFAPEMATAEFFGCDIDADCVAWVQANLVPPVAAVARTEAEPPLPYADESFDLVWATSVFSHLTDRWPAWLLELRRILRPGGLALLSVIGAGGSEEIAGEPWNADRIGMNVLGYGRPWHAGGPMVLHSEWWIRAHWGRAFEVAAFDPGRVAGQDGVLLRKPAAGPAPTVAALEAPERDEPRELAAALHAVRQLHREHAELNRSHDAYSAAYQEEAERAVGLRRRLERAERPGQAARTLLRGMAGLAGRGVARIARGR